MSTSLNAVNALSPGAEPLVARTLLGFALGGMPAVAMAYLSGEISNGIVRACETERYNAAQ